MLFNMAKSFGALTRSTPLQTALNEAHKMARRRLQHGGAATEDGADGDRLGGFIVPPDVDPLAMASAISAKLPHREAAKTRATEIFVGAGERLEAGRLIVSADCVRRIGVNDALRGYDVLERIVADIRALGAAIRAHRGV
jgi:hypothetical protein